jgi:hypothetical protein
MKHCKDCGSLITCRDAKQNIVGFLCNEQRIFKTRRFSLWCIKSVDRYGKLDMIDGKPIKHDKCNKED